MKKHYLLLILAMALFPFYFSSCMEEEVLPEATMEGKGTMGFLLNGELWVPKGYSGYSNKDMTYEPNYKGGSFGLYAFRVLGKDNPEKQFFNLYSANVQGVGKYDLSNSEIGVAEYSSKQCEYTRDTSEYHSGTLTITKFDLENRIISGTFEFTLANSECDTIKGTEGRFDMTL